VGVSRGCAAAAMLEVDDGTWIDSAKNLLARFRTGHPDLTPRSLTSEVRRKTCAHPNSPN
jgi:hypothetical protein